MISFFVVMIPVVLFVVGNNLYAKNVVRDKISETYRNTLDLFAESTDRAMSEISGYLSKLAVLDTDVGILASYPVGSDPYMLTKIRIQNKIQRDVGFYNLIDTIFVFSDDDLIFSTSGRVDAVKVVLNDNAGLFIRKGRLAQKNEWMLWYDKRMPGGDFLVRSMEVTDGLYVGAIIRVSTILDQLAIQWNDGGIGESAVFEWGGRRLGVSSEESGFHLPNKEWLRDDAPFRFVKDEATGKRFMIMNHPSSQADITTSIIIPESYMLQGLPYFQKVAYFMALGILLIFAFYLLFIRHKLFKPLQQLISGMRKISFGILDVRLQTNDTVELVFLANTFNNMAEQIKTLRIGMYEEQLRAQRIELKQLQAQINPHFYMNSLNIIYNFAALGELEPVKRMALHLGDYFRFIMRVNRDLITLEEELGHIESYLRIQSYRFPNKLSWRYDVPERMKGKAVPALCVQPFVENAIIHGFVNHRKPFVITIGGQMVEEAGGRFMLLAIEDNGVGFADDVLELLNAGEKLPQSETSRLGVLNVIQRLKLHYRGEASVTFFHAPGNGGAAVRIKLPAPPESERPEGESECTTY